MFMNECLYLISAELNLNVAAEQVITEMTDGGADYCFECVGMASLVQDAYASCRKVYVTLLYLFRQTVIL